MFEIRSLSCEACGVALSPPRIGSKLSSKSRGCAVAAAAVAAAYRHEAGPIRASCFLFFRRSESFPQRWRSSLNLKSNVLRAGIDRVCGVPRSTDRKAASEDRSERSERGLGITCLAQSPSHYSLGVLKCLGELLAASNTFSHSNMRRVGPTLHAGL